MRLAALLVAVASTLGLGGSSPIHMIQPPRDRFEMQDALAFGAFPLFDAGARVDGLPRTAVLRRHGSAEFVSFVYGDCAAGDDTGCPPPVEIQVWPACRRNLHLYGDQRPGTPVPERTSVRGVPAAFFEDGLRLELQASSSTIVVFGDSQARVRRVAAALRAVGKPPSNAPLPPPEGGAVEGKLAC